MFPHQTFIFMNQHKKKCVNKITRMPAAKKHSMKYTNMKILCLKGNLIDISTFFQRKTQ